MRFDLIAPFRILVLGVALCGITTAPVFAESTFSQTKLEAFVTAAMAVNELVRKWTPRIRSAEKGAEGAKLRAEADAELIAAVEGTDGMTVAEYREIGDAARKDQLANFSSLTGSANRNRPCDHQRWEVSLRAARLNTGTILSGFGRNPISEERENR